MGVEPFLVASSLVAVLAQRLVRVLCKECREAYERHARGAGGRSACARPDARSRVYRPEGCATCNYTGYRGRVGIFELMLVDDDIRGMVSQNVDSKIDQAEGDSSKGMHSLRADGARKVLTRASPPWRRCCGPPRKKASSHRSEAPGRRAGLRVQEASPQAAGPPAGTLDAETSRERAHRGCAATGSSSPSSPEKTAAAPRWRARPLALRRRSACRAFQRISALDLALVTRQAATLIGAGIPLVEGLRGADRAGREPAPQVGARAGARPRERGLVLRRRPGRQTGPSRISTSAWCGPARPAGALERSWSASPTTSRARSGCGTRSCSILIYPSVMFAFAMWSWWGCW